VSRADGKALTWTELRVGLVMLVSLVILALTLLYIGGGSGSPFAKTYKLKALMADVNGLKPGAPVRVGGLEVGTVSKVDFAPGASAGMIEVTMKLDRRIQGRITTASEATLGAVGLLGEKAVDIEPSTKGRPIEDGGYLSATAEDAFKSLMADASETTHHLNKVLARMDAGQGTIGKALRDEELYDRMADVAERLQLVMGKLESPQGPLGRLVNDKQMSTQMAHTVKGVDDVVTRIEQGRGPLGALSRDEQMVKDLKAATASLADVAGRLQRGEGSAGKLLTDDTLYKRLDATAARVDALMTRLESGEGTAGRIIKDPELYNTLNAAASDLRALIGDMRRDPRKYLRVKLSLF
jgi:phospholipid/cholesterol/gamma-HCH transport system substrate-binding protein